MFQNMTTVLQNIAGGQNRALIESAKKSEESKPYNEFDMAALMGYCGVTQPDHVPGLWPQLKQAKKVADQRALILNAMEQWAYDERKEIDTAFFLSKEVVEDIIKIQPNDTNTVGMNSTSARGVSNLVVLPRRMAEIEAMMKMEEAIDKTEMSRTLREAEKLAKTETRAPPRTYYTLKLNVATYAALVFVLYGRYCNLYKKLMVIYGILCSKEVNTCRDAFKPMICKQITWAIYDDSRSFFAKRLLPEHFEMRDIPFPTSMLDDIYTSVRYINKIERPTFPPSWLESEKPAIEEETQGTGIMAELSPYGNIPGYQHGRGRGNNGGRGNGGGRGSGNRGFGIDPDNPNGSYCPPCIADMDHFHPKIKEALTEFHEKFKGRVSIQRVMNAAGIWWPDMPKWEKHFNKTTNRSELCWDHLIGCCKYGPMCMFGRSHDDVKNIPDEFADNAIKVLKPGIEAMLKDGYRYDDGKRGFENHGRGAGRERNYFSFGSGGRGYYGPGGGDGKRFRRN
jgi:hypothetical protein